MPTKKTTSKKKEETVITTANVDKVFKKAKKTLGSARPGFLTCGKCGSPDVYVGGPGSHKPAGKKKAIKIKSIIQCRTCGHQEIKKK